MDNTELQERDMQKEYMQIIRKKYCMRDHQDGSNIYVGNKGEKKEKEKIH